MTTDISTMENFNSNSQSPAQLSEIQSFYKDMTIFLTGATGFMGNLILEKLIRTCSDLKRIYILIREKKGKTPEERFKELFDDPVFDLMKKEVPNYLDKISAVIGDCVLPDLGIGEQYQEILKNEVNIVIHSAATVRFDEHLRIAVKINIVALQDILKLSKQIKNLKSFVHISTAYSNCAVRKTVDEIFYKPPITGDKLTQIIDSLDDDYITNITPSLLKEWPNTYAMTKAIAEAEILTIGAGLPIGVIRPSMIIATDNEPIPGWINNYYGPTGVVVATGVGLMRCMRADPNKIADIVPGDYVSNAVLACAWDIHNKWKEYTISNTIKSNSFSPPIYNFVSSNSNPLTWGEFSKYNKEYGAKVPSTKSIWPIMLRLSKYKIEFTLLCFLLHIIPAFIIDSLAKLTGRTPKLMDGYRKLHKFTEVITYFSTQSWKFHEYNTKSLLKKLSKQDQHLFRFDMSKLHWNNYFQKHVVGLRIYIIKDPIENLAEGRRHAQKLNMAYYTLLGFLTAVFLLISYQIFLLFT